MTRNAERCSLYVGTYGKYNEGNLSGQWLYPADYDSKEEFLEACYQLHADEHDPELMFQDEENIPDRLYDESSISDECFDYCKVFDEWDDPEPLEAYVDLFWEFDAENFSEKYVGQFESLSDLGYYFADEMCLLQQIPDTLQPYFDYEAYGRDMSFELAEQNGYYFWNN